MSYLPIDENRNSYSPDTPQNESSVHTPANYSRSPLANHFEAEDAIEPVDAPYDSQIAFEPTAGPSVSTSSTQVDTAGTTLTKTGTIKKKASIKQPGTLSRRSSRRSVRIASLRGPPEALDEGFNNVFRIPVPTSGNPTEVLANRFQAWRKFLKDLIGYFREIQAAYEARAKALVKVSGAIQLLTPGGFLSEGGLSDAVGILRGYSKVSITEANRAREIEEDVITQLNGLRNDLNQKMKEIKSLSGDFKNSVEKEKDNTKRAVDHLRDSLALSQTNPSAASGKGDPYIARLAVERQVEKQIDEENYLHRAYLNLEGSGRELEAIVVGEIQKAFNAYAGILKREYDHAHEAVDLLRTGPIAMPKDHEWESFVHGNPNFINPNLPLRKLENIFYPGKFAPAAAEIRGGTLERKSKYLKSYTPGWYVLSATHIHEFKSSDHIHTQAPVMSLCLVDQKLGSHSQPGASSHKFNLKGRQTGGMHRGHSWVFRAETYEIMMAWYEDIKTLVEKTGEEKVAFMRKHIRITSGSSYGGTSIMSGDGLADDEADRVPFATITPMPPTILETPPSQRPEPGGHFAAGLSGEHRLQPPNTASAASSVYGPRDSMAGASSSAIHSQQNLAIPRNDGLESDRQSSVSTPYRTYGSQGAYGTPSRQSYEDYGEHPPAASAYSTTTPYNVARPISNNYQTPVSNSLDIPRQYSTALPPQQVEYQHEVPRQYSIVSPPQQAEYQHEDQLPIILPAQSNSRPRTPLDPVHEPSQRQGNNVESALHEPMSRAIPTTTYPIYESNAPSTVQPRIISDIRSPSDHPEVLSHGHEFAHEPAPHEPATTIIPVQIEEPLNYNPSKAHETAQQDQSYELPAGRSPPIQIASSTSNLNGAADPYHEEVGPTESAPGVFVNKTTAQDFSEEVRAPEEHETTHATNHSFTHDSSTHDGDAFRQVSKLAQFNGAVVQPAPSVSSTSDTDAASVIHLIPTPATEVYVGPPSIDSAAEPEKDTTLSSPLIEHSTRTQDVEEQAPRVSRFTEVGMTAGVQTGRWNGSVPKNGGTSNTTSLPGLRHTDTAATVMTVSDLPIPGKYISRE